MTENTLISTQITKRPIELDRRPMAVHKNHKSTHKNSNDTNNKTSSPNTDYNTSHNPKPHKRMIKQLPIVIIITTAPHSSYP